MYAIAEPRQYEIPPEVLRCFDHMTPPERRLAIAEHLLEEQFRRDVKRAPSKRAKAAVRGRRTAELLKLAFPPIFVKQYFGAGRELCSTQNDIWQELLHAKSEPFLRGLRRLNNSVASKISTEPLEFLAWFGKDADVPRIRKALASKDPVTLSAVLRGMELAAMHHRSPRGQRSLAAATAQQVVSGVRRFRAGESALELHDVAASCLRSVAPDTAREFLASDRCVRPGNPAIWSVLWSLYHDRDAGRRFVAPAAHDLWAVDDELVKQRARTDDDHHVRALLLTIAAAVDPENTRERGKALLAALKDKEHPAAYLVREALKRCKGHANPEELLARLRRTPTRFSSRAAGVLFAYELALGVMGDGLSVTLANGCQWRNAIQGADVLGLPGAAKAIRAAAEVFRRGGPPTDPRASMSLYESLSQAKLKALQRHDDAFDRHAERLIDAVPAYVAKHPTEFGLSR